MEEGSEVVVAHHVGLEGEIYAAEEILIIVLKKSPTLIQAAFSSTMPAIVKILMKEI